MPYGYRHSRVQNDFGLVQIVLDGANLFWTGPKYFFNFDMVKKLKFISKNALDLFKNNLDVPKIVFEPIEGPGIRKIHCF